MMRHVPNTLTTQQVADRLVCSLRTVRRLVATGDLNPDASRRPWVFATDEVERLAATRHAEAVALAKALAPTAKRGAA